MWYTCTHHTSMMAHEPLPRGDAHTHACTHARTHAHTQFYKCTHARARTETHTPRRPALRSVSSGCRGVRLEEPADRRHELRGRRLGQPRFNLDVKVEQEEVESAGEREQGRQ